MSGTHAGGKAAAATNISRYGKDYYSSIGKMGGKASGTGGFYHMKYVRGNLEAVIAAGAKGGSISRRGTIKVRPDTEGTKDHPDVTDERS